MAEKSLKRFISLAKSKKLLVNNKLTDAISIQVEQSVTQNGA